ncbi:MAG: hypothetical protein AUK35_02250 [Zetaproteobacteria bacterium CG2_30_46_52]|nr:MAG: hypothetical protein AUK35_02250 [Zetaproteobacteria bacterium CG2_30_46_52]
MKSKHYYAILNIEPQASSLEVLHAYRDMKQLYQPDSLAVYSLYEDDEVAILLAQVEEAYLVLSDADKRPLYDIEHGFVSSPQRNDEADYMVQPPPVREESVKIIRHHGAKPLRNIDVPDVVNGAVLKNIREMQGIGLSDIAYNTKISMEYLQAIEANDVAHFPAAVYMKSYLKQYAESIGMNSQLVLDRYEALHSS